MKYQFIGADVVSRIEDNGETHSSCSIHDNDFKEWLSAGNTPDPDPEMTPEKIAERAALAQVAADRRADILAKLSGVADAQLDAYIDTNVTNLTSATAYLKRLTKVTRALAIEMGVK